MIQPFPFFCKKVSQKLPEYMFDFLLIFKKMYVTIWLSQIRTYVLVCFSFKLYFICNINNLKIFFAQIPFSPAVSLWHKTAMKKYFLLECPLNWRHKIFYFFLWRETYELLFLFVFKQIDDSLPQKIST